MLLLHSPPGKHLSFYQGDIRLTKKQQENLKKYGDPTKGSANSRAASNVDSECWPNAVIPYTFDCSVGKFIMLLFGKILALSYMGMAIRVQIIK